MNVRNIPDLRVSLLPIEVLAESGFISHFSQGIWKLLKYSLVIAKGKKC